MKKAELLPVIHQELCRIAPEVEPSTLKPSALLRDQIDLDSMDWLNFLIALNKRLGVDIPETDYGQLVSIDALLDYLVQRTGG
jgi:acyl carrier protein